MLRTGHADQATPMPAADLLVADARAEHRVANPLVQRRVRPYLILDAEVAEDLHSPTVGDVPRQGLAVHRYVVIMMFGTPRVARRIAAASRPGRSRR